MLMALTAVKANRQCMNSPLTGLMFEFHSVRDLTSMDASKLSVFLNIYDE